MQEFLVNLKAKVISVVGEGLRQSLIFPALRRYATLEVSGLKYLPQGEPLIFAANHSSHLDAPLFMAALPLRWRLKLRVAAAADYFFNHFWKAFAVRLALNAVAFTRKGAGCKESLTAATRLLANGQSLLIFPEGTRSPDGSLQAFKWGVGWLAATSRARVVPVYIEGTHLLMPKGANWPKAGRVKITFGEPLSFKSGSEAQQIAAEIERQVRVLAPSLAKAA